MYYNNGNKYEGDFKNDKFEGKGIYYYNNEPWKDDKYEGEWKKVKQKEKEYIILIMEINMKVIGKWVISKA